MPLNLALSASQSHRTDQGSSKPQKEQTMDLDYFSRNPTIQIRAVPTKMSRSAGRPWPLGRNPTIQIRAVPRFPRMSFALTTEAVSQSHHTDQGRSKQEE